jgi:hypothetical protein
MNKSLVVGLSYLTVIAWGFLPTLSSQMSKAVASGNRDSLNGTLRERNVPEFVEQKSPTQPQTTRSGKTDATRTNTGSTEATFVGEASPTKLAPQQTKRLKIELDVSNPDDILVKEGQTVIANQLIADRQSERSTLTAQLQEVNLSIEKLKAAPKVSQLPPAGVKTLNSLPPKPAYTEEQAQITAAAAKVTDLQRKYALAQASAEATLPETQQVRGSKIAVKQAQEKIAKHQQKIDALSTLEDIDPAVKEHERVKLRELNRSLIEATTKLEQEIAAEGIAKATRTSHLADARFEITGAQRELQLARSRLATAMEKRKQLEFDYQIKGIEHAQQAQRTELERVKLQETNKLASHDREYQIAQLVLKKGQIQKQLTTLGAIRTPHQGTIRRVKLVAQHGSLLRYEVALVYTPNTVKSTKPLSEWQEEKL